MKNRFSFSRAALSTRGCAERRFLSGMLLMGLAAVSLAESPFVAAYPRLPAIRDKTLVAWVSPANLTQQGGGVLTLESSDNFDAIVFGERKQGAWMAGSEMFHRTEREQPNYPVETASPGTFVRMAAVYRQDHITLYRNDAVVADYCTANPPLTFSSGTCVLIGLRHLARQGQPGSYFAGVVEEARVYDRALSAAEIAELRVGSTAGPKPFGRWTFEDGKATDSEGVFPPGLLHGGAVIRGGKLYLNGTDAYLSTPAGRTWMSAFHFRPRKGNFADPIPFYWKGQYHIFYLQGDVGKVPWQHIASKDLVCWRELPTALVSDGAPDGPDGGHMFTGSVTEHAGTFHIFYTGHNPANPAALEVVRHATSKDLIHWTKEHDFTLGPDGTHYADKRFRNWRDPYVFWNPDAHKWWMVVIATDPAKPGGPQESGRAVQGLLVSDDLKTWQQQPPIPGGRGEECPDLFKIGDTWYLLGGGRYVSGKASTGPFTEPKHSVIDFPGVYAGKRMFDGKRQIWVGWAWDGPGQTDAAVAGEGVLSWGGFMCLPRELYPIGEGELGCRPAREIVALHSRLEAEAAPEGDSIPLSRDGMVECSLDLAPGAEAQLAVRQQPDGRAYRLIVRPDKGEVAFATPASEWVRRGCRIDGSRPLMLRVFLDGSIMECFVNDTYAITRRVYDLDGGIARVTGKGGIVKVRELRLKTRRQSRDECLREPHPTKSRDAD